MIVEMFTYIPGICFCCILQVGRSNYAPPVIDRSGAYQFVFGKVYFRGREGGLDLLD